MEKGSIRVNPKALNLEAVKYSQAKVTLGFKCQPSLKLALAQQAEKLGLTLSEHVENLILSVSQMQNQIDFYENDFMKELFKKFKDKEVKYSNNKNEIVTQKILDIKSIYTVIINSFKIKNND